MASHHPLADDDSDDFYAQLQQPNSTVPLSADAAALPQPAADGFDGLRQLAERGEWRALAERALAAREAAPPAGALQHSSTGHRGNDGVFPLTAVAYHVLALTRLRLWDDVAEALRGTDVDSAETPFALRWLAAEAAGRSAAGDPAAADVAHCRLLDDCVARVPAASADDIDFSALSGNNPEEERTGDDFEVRPSPSDGAAWARRAAACAGALAAHHARAQDWVTALRWMHWLLKRRPTDARLMSQTGFMMLSCGDVAGAETMFAFAAARPQANGSLVRQNAGLLRFAQRDYVGALAEFEAAAVADPADCVAASNIAVCRLFSGQGKAAVQQLEATVRGRPVDMLQESTAGTLARLYELGPPQSVGNAKRRLADFAARAGHEGFDPTAVLA